ncbi:hypothetical protein ACYSNM_13590 [Myroides sp. LJL116]
MLATWDKNGVKPPKTSVRDSLYFAESYIINAKDYIIEQAKSKEIVIINEAHHLALHRLFTKSLLQELYDNGYRYFGLEALFDTEINQRKYPILESGYYTKEPEFGNLITEALRIGFTLFSYEATQGKNNTEREIEQAKNIQDFIESVPKGKTLILCGYAHVYENEYPIWGKAMAGRLKENMQIDPLTIDQTMFLERSKLENNHLFMRLNNTQESIVLQDSDKQIFNGTKGNSQTDIVVIHPMTQYINDRPHWLKAEKKEHWIEYPATKKKGPLLILAYRLGEFENNGIPADIVEIGDQSIRKPLYLNKGEYTIVIKDNNYTIVDTYSIKID